MHYEITYNGKTIAGVINVLDTAIEQISQVCSTMPYNNLKYSLMGIKELMRDARGPLRAGSLSRTDEDTLKFLCESIKEELYF